MAVKSLLFLVGFALCGAGALFVPLVGVAGYILHYNLGPERQWWSAPIRPLGIRYSYVLAIMTALGVAWHFSRLRFGRLFLAQEKLALLFLGIVWLSRLISVETEFYTTVDHPSVKLTKVVIFALLLTHVVTNIKDVGRLFWVLVCGALILGLQAYSTSRQAFMSGRLESVGGPDFSDANFFAAYVAAMLPIIGVQFLRSGWAGKLLCLLAGAFATNAIVLTRSRGVLVGIACGAVSAVVLIPRRLRGKVLLGLIVAGLAGLYLTDVGFRERATTILRPEEERDPSAQSRVEIWRGGMQMLLANPLGVGPGNFQQSIKQYAAKYADRDAHSTFVRAACELGFAGIAVLIALFANAIRMLIKIMRRAAALPQPVRDDVVYASFGAVIALCVIAGCGTTITLLYVEGAWWLLALPACLARAVDNLEADRRAEPAPAEKRAEPGAAREGKA